MSGWAEHLVTFATIIGTGGLLAMWFDRRLRAARQAQAEAEAREADAGAHAAGHATDTAGWEQASVWRARWQEECQARETDRAAHRQALEDLAAEREHDTAAFQRLLQAETRARQALETRVTALESVLVDHGIPLPQT